MQSYRLYKRMGMLCSSESLLTKMYDWPNIPTPDLEDTSVWCFPILPAHCKGGDTGRTDAGHAMILGRLLQSTTGGRDKGRAFVATTQQPLSCLQLQKHNKTDRPGNGSGTTKMAWTLPTRSSIHNAVSGYRPGKVKRRVQSKNPKPMWPLY